MFPRMAAPPRRNRWLDCPANPSIQMVVGVLAIPQHINLISRLPKILRVPDEPTEIAYTLSEASNVTAGSPRSIPLSLTTTVRG